MDFKIINVDFVIFTLNCSGTSLKIIFSRNMFEIKNPSTGKKIQLATNDFETKLNWEQAIRACNELGDGWRLPDKEEMYLIFSQMLLAGKGSFKQDRYWTATEFDTDCAYVYYFYPETQNHFCDYPKEFLYWVRAVRNLSA